MIHFDIDKSVIHGKLIYTKRNLDYYLENLTFIFSFFLGIASSLLTVKFVILFLSKPSSVSLILIILILLSALVGFLSLFAFVNRNKLIKISGKNFDKNYKVITRILENRFDTSLNKEPKEVIRIRKRATFWKIGVRVIVILKEENIHVNIARFNYRDMESPFHVFFDYLKIRAIRKEFRDSLL